MRVHLGVLGSTKAKNSQDFKKEWHAMYTTQKTQKSKKYHDGILHLSVSICNQKQVTLLNEDGAVLGSKYLNPAADIRTGNSLEITNYLVDIGDPKMFHGADQQNHCSTQEGMSSFPSSSKLDKSHGGDSRSKGETKGSSLGKDRSSHSISSNVDKRTADGNAKLIRDAHQILFTLKRPIAPPSSRPTNKSLSQTIDSSRSSQSQSTIQDKSSEHDMQRPNLLKNEVIYDSKDSNSEVRCSSTMSTLGSNISHSKAAKDFADIEIKNLSDEPKSNISLGCPEKSSMSSIAKCRVPDIIQPEDVQTQDKTKSTALPSGNDGKITNNDAYENSNQHSAAMVVDGRLVECTTSSHVDDVDGKSLEKKMNVREEKMKMDEFPSFDLGF
ncbi:hypothetical protein Syun_019766 [Stephania yunnanensis]|uniref:5'-3' DNA helicase ZGRF1-like N-terminal domain-containing protein n=1 Tax=Stephania yunnanensis TaxID=152371 RepID=A0AAP0IUT4_9MAGN